MAHPIVNALEDVTEEIVNGRPVTLALAESTAATILSYEWAVRVTYLTQILLVLDMVENYEAVEAGARDALEPMAAQDLRSVQLDAQTYVDRVAPLIDPVQVSYRGNYGAYFQMPRLISFPATDGETTAVVTAELERAMTDPKPVADPTGGYATAATFDAWGFCMDPGTLEVDREWETPPALHPVYPYYEEQGVVEPLPEQPPVTWSRLFGAIGEPLPTTMAYSVTCFVWQVPRSHPEWTEANQGWGWRMEAEITWDARATVWGYSVGFGADGAANTWNWKILRSGGAP